MSARMKLEIQQSQLVYAARLAAPTLRIVPSDMGLAERLVHGLSDFGATLESLTLHFAQDKIVDSHLRVAFLGGWAAAQISPLGVELSFNGADFARNLPFVLPQPELERIVLALEGIVGFPAERAEFASHTFSLRLHTRLLGRTPAEILSTCVLPAPGYLGAAHPLSVMYEITGNEPLINARILVEPSATITPDGLFISGVAAYRGEGLTSGQAASAARGLLSSILKEPQFPFEVDYS